MADQPNLVKQFLAHSNAGRHAGAFRLVDQMTAREFAEAAVSVHGTGDSGTRYTALREAAILAAQAKLSAEQIRAGQEVRLDSGRQVETDARAEPEVVVDHDPCEGTVTEE
ncbi:MAG: hypothetical protein WEB59_00645 [Thermoanaerobaculia bacterium]